MAYLVSSKFDNFKPDFNEAYTWYNKALLLGKEESGLYIGYLYSDEKNPYKDYEKAKKYLKPWIQRDGYDIAKFEYESVCARQKFPIVHNDESISFYDNNGELNYKLLTESARKIILKRRFFWQNFIWEIELYQYL